jgi:hypothetical protein
MPVSRSRWYLSTRCLLYEPVDRGTAYPELFGYLSLVYTPDVEPIGLVTALAVWQYCEDSAMLLFGDRTGDWKADAILKALKESGGAGLTRTELYDVLDRHVKAMELSALLGVLEGAGWAYFLKEPKEGKGKPAERWFAVGE